LPSSSDRDIIRADWGATKLKKLNFALSVAAMAIAGQAHAGDKVLYAKPPAWVLEHPAAAAPSDQGNLPYEVQQVDTQKRFDGDTETTFTLVRLKFLTSQGLQAGNLSYSWEPDKGDLTVNRVLIHRGDKTIDVLAAGQTFTVLRREQGLDQATLDGTLTANMFPEGLQVGDVIEAAVTITRTDPVVGGHVEANFGPLNFPAERIDLSLQWPTGRPVALTSSPDLPQWQREKVDGFETATMTLQAVKPIVPPSGAPVRYRLVRMADASDYRSWNEVAAIEVPLYAKASVIPADGPLRAEVEKIRAASKDPVARAAAALQLVESRIRYVALEMGAGGLVPADAATTWSRRFGDCKAKTALLLGILHELAIEAEPVAVNTGAGDALNSRLPAVHLFDHILVRATIAGKTYWLDGTRTGDTSLARLTVPDFSWGLPISKGITGLVRMIPPPLQQPESDLAIDLDASKGIRGAVPVKIDLTLRGDDAIGANQGLAALAGSAREEALRKYWRGRFDFIDPQAFDAKFDADKGELYLTMQGTATLDWKDGWHETDETGVGYRADFSRASGAGHDAPFAVIYPLFEHTRETVLLPPGFTGKVTSDKTDVDETIAGFEYHRHATLTGNKFVVERSERSLVPEIPYKDAVAAEKRLRDLSDDAVYLRIPENYRPTPGDLAVLASTDSKDPAELVEQGETLEDGGKYADALGKFARATQIDPKNVEAWADRAFANLQIGQLPDAESALERAAALDPKNVVVLNTRGAIAETQHNFQAALENFEAALKLYPNNTFAATHRVSSMAAAGRTKEALAAADQLIASNPRDIQNYEIKTFLLMKQGDHSEGEKTIDAMVAANPGDPQANAMGVELYLQFGFSDKARALTQATSASQPTALSLYNRARVVDASDADRALADLDQALRLDPHLAAALVLRAQLRASRGRRDEALADADEAVRVSPGSVEALSARAEILASIDKREQALQDVEKAIAVNPRHLESYLLKANLLRDLGRKDDALKVPAELVAASPQETYAHVAAAKIYDAFGERDKALAEFDRALAIGPQAYIYINRAQVLAADDIDGRMADVERALKLEPEMPEALAMKADLLTRKGENADAVQLYSKLLDKDPSNSSYLDRRAIALWRAGKHDEAQRDFAAEGKLAKDFVQLNNLCYQKARADVALELALDQCEESLKLQPGAPSVLDSLGSVYLQMGRYKEAEGDFDRALEKSPEIVTSLIGRAIAKLHLGDKPGARADLAAALKIDSKAIDDYRAAGFTVPTDLTT
jgi:tetratricopeptide (TPR) repeat protein